MNTTADKLNGLKATKEAIKQAIIDKGVAVDEAATFASYATKIGEIQAGGGGEKGLPQITTYPDKRFTSVESNAWLFEQIKSIDWTEFNKLGITNMSYMFNKWKGKTLDIANLSTTGVTDMSDMFSACQNLTSLDVSHFDTNQVTDMVRMFDNCNELTSLDLSSFDTSQVTNMGWMFQSCFNMDNLNLSSFDTTNVTNFGGMFNNFGSDIIIGNINIIWGNNWASNPAISYFYATISNLTRNSVLDLFNKLAVRDNTPTVSLKSSVYSELTPDELAIAQNKGWTVTGA